MTKHVLPRAYVVAAPLMCTTGVKAHTPVRNDNLTPFYRDVRGGMCSPTNKALGMIPRATPLSTLLFDGNRGPTGMAPAPCNMVLAPDGHQLTLGEFKAAAGRVVATCIDTGTHTAIHFSGLVPKQTYTVWLFKVNPSPPPPYVGAGTLGVTALSENHFLSSEAGEGEI